MIVLNAQNDARFKTTTDYLSYLEKEFDIDKTNVYQFDSKDKNGHLSEISAVIFLKGNKYTTMKRIRNATGNLCPEKKFFKLLTVERIEATYKEDNNLQNIIFKNLVDQSITENSSQAVALFLFTVNNGKLGLMYYKHCEYLEKLGFKCMLICLDEAEIGDLRQPNSRKVELIR